MYDLIRHSENYIDNIYDTHQDTWLSYITSKFFPWLCLVLLINGKNFKNQEIIIVFLHWFLKSTGNLLEGVGYLLPVSEYEKIHNYWPYNANRWLIGKAIASVFLISGEIIGDLYMYIRTRALTPPDNKKVNIVFIVCFVYNTVKIIEIYSFFSIVPADCRSIDENGKAINKLLPYAVIWWVSVMISSVTCFFYNLFVIFALKSNLSKRIRNSESHIYHSFSKKFKLFSELRIIISMILTLILLPLVITVVYEMSYYAINDPENIKYIDPEPLRKSILDINYCFMYIDQILICYIRKNSEIGIGPLNSLRNSKLDYYSIDTFSSNTNDYNINNHHNNHSKNIQSQMLSYTNSDYAIPITPNSMTFDNYNTVNDNDNGYNDDNDDNNNNNISKNYIKNSLYRRNANYENTSYEALNVFDESLLTLNDDNNGNNNNRKNNNYNHNNNNKKNDYNHNKYNSNNNNSNSIVDNNNNNNNNMNMNYQGRSRFDSIYSNNDNSNYQSRSRFDSIYSNTNDDTNQSINNDNDNDNNNNRNNKDIYNSIYSAINDYNEPTTATERKDRYNSIFSAINDYDEPSITINERKERNNSLFSVIKEYDSSMSTEEGGRNRNNSVFSAINEMDEYLKMDTKNRYSISTINENDESGSMYSNK
ncbi:hypothetical protein BCR32DRAFT_295351 [Anaeromyces robustus]|uniref:Uncharacterized protein n=1 Tax=Anaeromyces robustus TaxID=1754192 RepID=A0A1Y1WWF3_9FUNG|nr:hypothetical protein BCR32DRAFT_295351 [Anaeromyces robustus]|eukprot:ORX77887.1 hypothetical protein BCR32DRAFT_295351 [Anaeromyces robustus]